MCPKRDLLLYIGSIIREANDMSGLELRDIFVAFVSIVISITIHEYGHALMADKLGDPTPREHGRVTLNPFVIMKAEPFGTVLIPLIGSFMGFLFGYASTPINLSRVRREVSPRRAEFLISIAGPLSNVVLFLIASGAYVCLIRSGDPSLDGFIHLTQVLIIVNVILAVFNLFPIPPLDGFSVLRSLQPDGAIIGWLEQHGNLLFLIFFLTAGRIFGPIMRGIQTWLAWLGAG